MLKPPRESRVVICGTARNVEQKLEKFFYQLSKSFSEFREVHFFIVESFSEDLTLGVLEKLAKDNPNIRFTVDSGINVQEKRRTVRIASARNRIVYEVQNTYSDFDYVVVADMDGVNRNLTSKAVLSCWNHPKWDAMFSNQPHCYYDIWALRAIGWSETDCWEEYDSLKLKMDHELALKLAVTDKMRSIIATEQLVPVISAFGGIGIYKRDVFIQGVYIGEYPNGKECCEHVPFHQGLIDKGLKLYINPALVNISPLTQRLTKLKEKISSTRFLP